MKKFFFVKMHWTWNDFIVIDENDLLSLNIFLTEELIQKMCSRNFWIWADWILLVWNWNKADFKYKMYNKDWTLAEMCWNWIRCYMKYLYERWLINTNNVLIETLVWVLNVEIDKEFVVVDMWKPWKIKNLVYKTNKLWDRFPMKIDKEEFIFIPISMWNPHAVIFCKDVSIFWCSLEKLDVKKYWKKIENYVDIFPNKTNVEFVKVLSNQDILMRVWERWIWETLASWTWACASVVAWILSWKLEKNIYIKVKLPWWLLEVKWSWNLGDSVIMRWEAKKVYEWYYFIDN